MKFYIKTFGCVQNIADSDQITQNLKLLGHVEVDRYYKADLVIINSCVVRESAENRVYGLIENIRNTNRKIEIVVTGCLTGWIDKNRAKKSALMANYADVKFVNITSFDIWKDKISLVGNKMIVPISFGCNNYCSYCLVPFSRGREKSRNFEEIINDCLAGYKQGIREVLLVGQNVNSYGSDLVENKAIYRMGKKRNPSLFPPLLNEVSKIGLDKISFISSNPWDFSDELIEVIARNQNIDRLIHLPIQSGDNSILTKMNRGYTVEEYINLVKKIREKVRGVEISTDIIVGFPGETEDIFEKSLSIYKQIGFKVCYINKYSPRLGTLAAKLYEDDIPPKTKRERWRKLDKLINSYRK